MSTLIGGTHTQVLESEQALDSYFQAFAKQCDAMRVGLEAEFFAVDQTTGKALPYHGPKGIHAILKILTERFHYEPILEDENTIGLQRGDSFVALEPGGQIELSAPPVSTIFEIESQVSQFLKELAAVRESLSGICFLAVGMQPFSALDEIAWVPKHRYEIMAKYLGEHGTLSHEMMKRTATNQINFDYLSEEHAMSSLRVALGITSIVTALFANSSFSEGKPNGYLTRRLEIWNQTDPDRTGLLVSFTHPNRTFRDYLEYLLEMPMIFIVRKGRWIPLEGRLTFRQFIREGFGGIRATVGDFELHLSFAFPEARLKQYLEIRGVDGQSPDLIPSVAAFWKGILYDARAREEAWKLVAFASDVERLRLHHAVPKEGLKAKLGTKPIEGIARDLVDLACRSLGRQTACSKTQDECVFLERIRERILKPGKSPAETLLDKWERAFKHDPKKLIQYLSVFSDS